jgi:hypothetical protein
MMLAANIVAVRFWRVLGGFHPPSTGVQRSRSRWHLVSDLDH